MVRVRSVAEMSNVSADPQRAYRLSPEELLAVDRRARERDEEIVGYYHSHPASEATPSSRDRAEAWPKSVYLIVGPSGEVTAWRLGAGGDRFERLSIESAHTEAAA